MSNKLGISISYYSRLENNKRCWTMSLASKWINFILDELDKLPKGTVNFSKVPDFSDIEHNNNAIPKSPWTQVWDKETTKHQVQHVKFR